MQILDKTFTGGSSHPKQIKNNHRLLALILLLTNMKIVLIFQQNTLSLYLTIILTLTGYKTFTTRAWKERMEIIDKLILIIPTCDASPSSVGPRFILVALKDSLHEAAPMPGHVRIESGAV